MATDLSLSSQSRISLMTSGISGLGSVADSYFNTSTQATNYSFQSTQSAQNAEMLLWDARDIIKQGDEAANQIKAQGLQVRGEQRTAMSASGFEVDSGSYQDIIDETDYQIAKNVESVKTQASLQAANKIYESQMATIQSNLQSEMASILQKQAVSSAIGGTLTSVGMFGVGYYG